MKYKNTKCEGCATREGQFKAWIKLTYFLMGVICGFLFLLIFLWRIGM